MITAYLNQKALSEGTYKQYRSTLSRIETKSGKPLLQLTKPEIIPIIQELPATSSRKLCNTILKGFYQYALKQKLVDEDPTDDLTFNNGSKKQFTRLTEEDFKQMNRRCEGLSDLTILNFMWYTGVRSIELRHVRVSDVRLDKGYVEINRSKTNKGIRKIPIHRKFKFLLERYLTLRAKVETSSEYLFLTNRKKQMSSRAHQTLVKRFQQGLGTDFTSHDFRRAFVTRLYQKTKDIVLCQKLAGHKDISVTREYIIDDDEETADQFNAIDF